MNKKMNLYIVLLLAGCMFCGFITTAAASSDELEIVYNDVTLNEDNTLLTVDITVKNVGEGENEYCLLDIFASPSPNTTSGAGFLGWAYIPVMQAGESKDYRFQMSMPADLAEGDYYPTAMIACYDLIVSYPEKVLLKPGNGIAAYLTGADTGCKGPDYAVTEVNVPETPSSYMPVDNFAVTVTVVNNGKDDVSTSIVPVHAFLGDWELGPLTSVIQPLAAGEVSSEELLFLIPDNMPRGSYPLTFIIDPYGENGLCGVSDDRFETGKTVIIAEELPAMPAATSPGSSDFPAYDDKAECSICNDLTDF